MASPGQGKKRTSRPAAPKREEVSADKVQGPGEQPADETKTLGWMKDSPEWGIRAKPSKRGLTLDDMCARCHIGKDQAFKIDYGDTDKMRVGTLKKVAKVLRCPWVKLAG